MRLCFGVLGKILRACKLETVTDPMLIGTLTRTVDPTCQYAESEGSSISRLLSCGQNLSNGQERRVGRSGNDLGYQTNRLSNVVSAAQTANVSVVARKVQDDFLQLIDEDKKRYIVPAIRDVIDQDDSLDVEKHMNFMKFFGVPKAEFLSVHVYELPRVIAQTLLFCCVAVKNSTGKESSKQITSEYVTKFSEPETYKVVFNLVQASEAKTVDTKKTDSYMQLSLVDEEPVSSYLLKLEDKYRTAKTLLYKHEPVPLYSFYVCNNIIEKVPVQSKATTTMSYSIKVIENATAKKIEECSRFVIIAGTGGLGKSMMLQHLLLNAISNYSESGIMPVFVQVRDYQGTSGDIFEYLYSKVSHFGTGFTPEAFKTMLNNGRVLFLLDGLDEIGVSNETLFEKGLSDFIDRYPFNYYVISSRPHRSFVSYSRFTVLQLQPFTKAQSLDLVDKLVYRPEIKTKFREELDEHLYRDHILYCKECGAKLYYSHGKSTRKMADGTTRVYLREAYRCYTKLNHPNGCAGPSSYSAELINDAVLKEIRRFLGVIKAIPQENLLEKAREKHDGVNEVAYRQAEQDYFEAHKQITALEEQAIKALTGENSLDISIVNSMMPKYREKMEQAQRRMEEAKTKMDKEKEQSKEARREIGDLVSWADAFDEADPETRKMIIARLVERIDIGADYSISIRFRISMKQYTGEVA